MKNFYFLFFLSFPILSFCQDEIQYDLVLDKSIQYDLLKIETKNPHLKELVGIEYGKIRRASWKGIEKVNALIKQQAETINSEEFSIRVKREYRTKLRETLRQWYNDCVGSHKDDPEYCGSYAEYYDNWKDAFTFEGVFAEFKTVSLCDNILIAGMHVTYSAERESYLNRSYDFGFHDLHYYDLDKGIEIDPNTILNKKTKRSFLKLIKSRIPDHLHPIADTLDFDNGLPIFIGASFYYLIHGNLETYTDDQIVLQVRLSFDEAVPFLNPTGPLMAYANFEKLATKYNGMTHGEIRHYDHFFEKRISAMESFDKLIESLSGKSFIDQKAIVDFGSANYYEVHYNKNGLVENHKIVVPKQNIVDDSVSYTYYRNGNIKLIEIFEEKRFSDPFSDEEQYKLALEELYEFDEQQNLTRKVDFGYINFREFSFDQEIEYFTYFGDRVVRDYGNVSDYSMGYFLENETFAIIEGNIELTKSSEEIDSVEYRIERNDNETRLVSVYSGHEYTNWRYFTLNGKINEIYKNRDNTKILVNYDEHDNIVSLTKYRKGNKGYIISYKTEAQYDEQNRPLAYSFYVFNRDETVNNSRTYNFQWNK